IHEPVFTIFICIRNACANGAIVVTMTGIKIQNASNTGVSDSGGAIDNAGGDLTLDHVTVTGNHAVNGGGIRNNGTLALLHSVLSNNFAGQGAGIYNEYAAHLTVDGSTISGNIASINGGGIGVEFTPAISIVRNSTISGNSAPVGGGIYKA